MLVRSVGVDAVTKEEWLKLESCWAEIHVSVPVADTRTKHELFDVLFQSLLRYLDQTAASRGASLLAVRYDGHDLTLFWESWAAMQASSELLLSKFAFLTPEIFVEHRLGFPAAASRPVPTEAVDPQVMLRSAVAVAEFV